MQSLRLFISQKSSASVLSKADLNGVFVNVDEQDILDPLLDDVSQDRILRGRLTLCQPKDGYRFSVDPLLLADFVGGYISGNVVDIGAGVGVLGLSLARMNPSCSVTLIELQKRLAGLCEKNMFQNRLDERCSVVQGDVLTLVMNKQFESQSFDWVVSCPPYYRVGSGLMNPNAEEALARHEIMLPLKKLVGVSKQFIRVGGHVAFVYPSSRLPEMFAGLIEAGLRPVRLRLVYPKPEQAAQRALILAVKGSRSELCVDPPFFIRDSSGAYTKEAQRALGEDEAVPTR